MKRKFLKSIVVAASIILSLVLFESTLKLAATFKSCHNYDISDLAKSRGFSLEKAYYEPNTSVHHCNVDFNYVYTIDSTGLRNSVQAPSHTVSIGDSFTFGFGVDDDKNYSYLINSKNAGLWGNTFDVQHKSYIRNIELFHPKTVVWTIYPPHLISLTQSNWSTNCPGDFEITLDRFGISEQLFKPIQSSLLNKSVVS